MKNLYIISLLWLIFLPVSKAFAKIANPPTANRTLSVWVQSINRITGDVMISGGDSRGPSTPTLTFTWLWGDGTSNNGFFPQTKKYVDKNRKYIVKVIANYPNNEKDSVQVVVDFTTEPTEPTERTLSAWIQSINRTTGDVIITGVDIRPVSSFLWIWGDGTSNNGFFPQTKKYTDKNRNYVVKVISNYPNNEKDSVEVVVDFTTVTTERTLSAWVQSINRTTGDVIITGVDTRGPSTPTLTFTWIWGDGTSNNGFFPQTKKYADKNRNYVVKVISNYPNNEKDSVEVVVDFTTLNLGGIAVSGTQQAAQTLISTQTIPPNTNVTYQAGNSISLQGAFNAQSGSVFKAEIKRDN